MAEGSVPVESPAGSLSTNLEIGELHKPLTINVFAIEDKRTKTHEDNITKQGFGYSTPLDKPEISESTYYKWQGRLHPITAEHGVNAKGDQSYIGSSNVRDSIEELAANLAQNCRDRQDLVLQGQGKDSYSLQLEPTQEQINELKKTTNSDVARVVRALKPEEQKKFLDAFHQASVVSKGK